MQMLSQSWNGMAELLVEYGKGFVVMWKRVLADWTSEHVPFAFML